MSQVTDMTVPGSPLTMATLASALEAIFAALGSQNRGATAPSNPYEGMLWWDSSGSPAEILKRYAATAGWINILSLNTTTGAMVPYRSGTALGTMATETAADYSKTTAVVLKSLFDANTILAADADDTPAALAIAEQRLIGRITGGNIAGLTAAQVKTLLAIVEADITLSDNTTGDSSTSKHGFCPKLPNDTAKYLRGDGTWAAPSGAPGDASVSQAKLKTSSGEVSSSASGHQTLPGGAYGFYPQTKCSYSSSPASAQIASYGVSGGAYATLIYFDCGALTTMYAKQTYVTSSGEVFWLFLLLDKATGKVVSTYASPDHPCMGHGGKPLVKPHPFPDYDEKRHEIVVINPTPEQIAEIDVACEVEDEDKPDRSRLDVILEDYDIDEKADVSWPETAVTVGITRYQDSDGNWQKASPDALRRQPDGTPIEVLKKAIPRPEGVKLAGLVAKAVAKG